MRTDQTKAVRRGNPPLLIALDRTSKRPLFRQLYESIRGLILAGRLRGGTRLSSTRVLANDLGVARTTVVLAYEQLRAEGFVHGHGSAGTIVSTLALPSAPNTRRVRERAPATVPKRTVASELSGRSRPFRVGEPATELFPERLWTRLCARRRRNASREFLGYGDGYGYRPLRRAIAEYTSTSRGVRATADQVVLVRGAQQAIDLVARILLKPDDKIWFEDPGYPTARRLFEFAGATIVDVPLDAEGLRVDACMRLAPDARLAYVAPSHQFPLGRTMSIARRLALLDWAARSAAWIVEDDYDSEFRFPSQPIASLQGLDTADRVLYVGTFSKTVFPALRLGYLILPPALVERFAAARALLDHVAPTVEQAALADFIDEGHFTRHLRRMRTVYGERKDSLLSIAAEELAGRHARRARGRGDACDRLDPAPGRRRSRRLTARARARRRGASTLHVLPAGQAPAGAPPRLCPGPAARDAGGVADAGRRIARLGSSAGPADSACVPASEGASRLRSERCGKAGTPGSSRVRQLGGRPERRTDAVARLFALAPPGGLRPSIQTLSAQRAVHRRRTEGHLGQDRAMNTRAVVMAVAVVAGQLLTPVATWGQQPHVTAFVNFHVVPMTSDTVLRNHTVVVVDGRITAVGPVASTPLPANATRVDGMGSRYLLPALADMHTHTVDTRELALYASHGVLTILNLGWSPDSFVAEGRHHFDSGERFGPVIFEGRRMNQPYGNTSGIATIAQARDTVRYAKALGYEFIKVYSFLSDTVYAAIMQEAAAIGMTVVGHQTNGIGLARGLRAGLRMVAHAEELRAAIGVPLTEEGADSTVRLFSESGAWLTPTLSTFEAISNTWGNPDQLEAYIVAATQAQLPETTIRRWRASGYQRQSGSVADRNTAYVEITRRLHRAHVPMLAGTDGPGIPGMLPGIAIHEELRLLQSIGMSRYEALAAATSNAGRFIAQYAPGRAPFGTVSVGARADLLVTTTNPLQDLDTLREPELVVRLGRPFTIAQRDSIRHSLQ